MAKANYLSQIRKRMDDLQKEFSALSEAHELLSAATGTRGRKAKLPTLGELVNSVRPKAKKKSRSGRPGRPPGSKSKPGSKKPGPKPNSSKAAAKSPVVKAESKTLKAPKAAGKKRGRKPSSKAVKAKPAVSGKRKRIANVSGKITDIVAKANRFTTNSFITDKLVSLYPDKSRVDLGKYISVILANMKSRKELLVLTTDSKGNKMRSGLWGLPSWFDGSKPKSEFLK